MAILTRGEFCEIRRVGREAADALLGVYRACEDFLGLGPQLKADMTMVLKDLDGSRKSGGVFCSIHDLTGEMIGVVGFTPGGFEGQPEVAFVSLLMVVPGRRDRGIGTEAVELIEREIGRDPLVTMIHSAVQVNNPDARRFWLRHGYQIIGEPEARPDGTTVLNLQKDVSHAA